MNNSLPFDPLGSSQQPEKAQKSVSYIVGRGLGKAVVFARNKLSGVSQAVHHSIENDVKQRLAEQEAFHEMLHQQQEISYCEEIEKLKRRHLKVVLSMSFIGLLMGAVSTAILFWYY
ncbi:hypothetical protein [Histophilus somni]|uniref:Uncharacterized protein n=2 Tax=Histophilus somni TaxID=731 RepID=A0AAX2S5L2_HISSO|nr:hypothetical protein [Histophilus somni]TDF40827.1 hypothetical protein E1290_03935 [Histophilus somni]TEW31343.1 hypothetical protein E2R48_00335 [Histophilus somni]TFF02690.1 hypothetical protein E3U35_01425 [Histophilus somni]THA97391.1 hypothetical protein E6A58_00335 [Histophilus somni]TJY53337.1 hypothetical protein FAZ28_01500 [Histophilus somni]